MTDNLFYKQLQEACEPKPKEIIKQDILIIKCPYYLTEKDHKEMYEQFLFEKFKGLVVLPPGYEAVYIPHDCEVVLETEGERKCNT